MYTEHQDFSAHQKYSATIFYDLRNQRGDYIGLVKARTSLTTLLPIEQEEWTIVVADELAIGKQEYSVSCCQLEFDGDAGLFIFSGHLKNLMSNRLM